MAVNQNSIKALKSFKSAGKFIEEAPLASKGYFIRLEQPVREVLDQMSSDERTYLIRRAIGEALVREGLLKLEGQSNGNSN